MAEYIDREAVMKALADRVWDFNHSDFASMPEWNDAVAIVENIPAADVKPVVHAHWYVDDGCAYCSNCRNNFRKAILKAVKYCPMCGAQIEGYGGHPDAGPPTPYDLLYEEGGANTT